MLKIFYYLIIILLIRTLTKDKKIESTVDWFYNFSNDKYLLYEYNIDTGVLYDNVDKPSLRKLASSWILSKYYLYCKSNYYYFNANKVKNFILKGLLYFENFIIKKGDYYYFQSTNLACLGFYMMTLNNLNLHNRYYDLFYKSILNNQILTGKNTGAFYTNWNNNDINNDIKYIPSQLCLTLLSHYNIHKNKKLLNRIDLALRYYYNILKNNKNISLPWFIQPCYQMFIITKNTFYSDIVFELGDILITYNMLKYNMDNVTMSVGTWMEGLIDSYNLAVLLKDKNRINLYINAIHIGIKNMDKLKMKSTNKLINNGFIASTNIRRLRIDWNQHALSVYLKYISKSFSNII